MGFDFRNPYPSTRLPVFGLAPRSPLKTKITGILAEVD
jgi:hypothetical protein